jgi:hypothetical protein
MRMWPLKSATRSGVKSAAYCSSTVRIPATASWRTTLEFFDTLGYEQYENSEMLTKLLVNRTDYSPIEFEVAINHQQPVYIVEPAKKPGFSGMRRESSERYRGHGGSKEFHCGSLGPAYFFPPAPSLRSFEPRRVWGSFLEKVILPFIGNWLATRLRFAGYS